MFEFQLWVYNLHYLVDDLFICICLLIIIFFFFYQTPAWVLTTYIVLPLQWQGCPSITIAAHNTKPLSVIYWHTGNSITGITSKNAIVYHSIDRETNCHYVMWLYKQKNKSPNNNHSTQSCPISLVEILRVMRLESSCHNDKTVVHVAHLYCVEVVSLSGQHKRRDSSVVVIIVTVRP